MPEYLVKIQPKSSDKKAVIVKTYQPSATDAETDALRQHPGGKIVSVERKGAVSNDEHILGD